MVEIGCNSKSARLRKFNNLLEDLSHFLYADGMSPRDILLKWYMKGMLDCELEESVFYYISQYERVPSFIAIPYRVDNSMDRLESVVTFVVRDHSEWYAMDFPAELIKTGLEEDCFEHLVIKNIVEYQNSSNQLKGDGWEVIDPRDHKFFTNFYQENKISHTTEFLHQLCSE